MSTDTSAALFSLGARIAAPLSAESDHLARHAGLAQGIAQVIAALPHDAARRQLFVPLQVLQQHGGDIEEVFSGKQTPNIACRDRSTGRRGPQAPARRRSTCWRRCRRRCGRIFLPLALVRRDLERMARADADPFAAAGAVAAADPVDAVARVAAREFGG